MKNILYATDYSQNSVAALRLAHLLTKKFDAKLFVMHVFDIPITLSTVSISHIKKEKRLLIENHNKLKEFCAEHLGDTWEGCSIDFIVEENASVVQGILENATKHEGDLIVVGTKGTSAVKDFLFGSATTAMIKKAPCALLAVPVMSPLEDFKTMVYATDFEQADIFAINRLVEIAKKFNSKISIVHISTSREYAGDQQMEWFKEMLIQKVTYDKMEFDLILDDDIFEGLNRYLVKSNASLLAMLERKDNSFSQKFLQTDMIKKMVSGSNVPLISFNIGGL
ncbi:universal stress protein [Arenibacter echinorum]|uniref:Nucleotide-binding universal stress UspA family protein n=1 Tax=Arenibacter echinorum TaxID=440515 RepID=A0A327RFI3_9FLAO|nr:universal stress protein [Arenibacter echinorum]RAJ15746.1 nucleotide-binding universal stress UspA family protein [Arenibacter echinorum]